MLIDRKVPTTLTVLLATTYESAGLQDVKEHRNQSFQMALIDLKYQFGVVVFVPILRGARRFEASANPG